MSKGNTYINQPTLAPTRKVTYSTLSAIGGGVVIGVPFSHAVSVIVIEGLKQLGIDLSGVTDSVEVVVTTLMSGAGAFIGGWLVREMRR